jgi:hypothetical protein
MANNQGFFDPEGFQNDGEYPFIGQKFGKDLLRFPFTKDRAVGGCHQVFYKQPYPSSGPCLVGKPKENKIVKKEVRLESFPPAAVNRVDDQAVTPAQGFDNIMIINIEGIAIPGDRAPV